MIKLTKEKETQVAEKLQRYFIHNTDFELSQFTALQLVDFLNEEIGSYYYNQAIADAESFMNDKVADLVLLEK